MAYTARASVKFDAFPGSYPLPEKHLWTFSICVGVWSEPEVDRLLDAVLKDDLLLAAVERL